MPNPLFAIRARLGDVKVNQLIRFIFNIFVLDQICTDIKVVYLSDKMIACSQFIKTNTANTTVDLCKFRLDETTTGRDSTLCP
jgi:hypothetical protein